ncbi:MAG: DnaB-like helicase C-terminal domain-containing protein [Mycobacteriales bacterium]
MTQVDALSLSARSRTLASILDMADGNLRDGGEIAARQWPTGLQPLDTYLGGGLRAGELTLLGGPQGLGKTTFALQIVRNVASAGGTALYICYEHDERELLERMIGMESGLSSAQSLLLTDLRHNLRRQTPAPGGLAARLGAPGQGQKLVDSMAAYGEHLHFARAHGARTTVQHIKELINGLPDQGVVVVDYLQKVAVPGDIATEDERVTRIVEGLKDLALDANVPIVAIVAADKTGLGAGRTRLHHLRGSSALAYEADVALMLNDKFGVVARHHLMFDQGAAASFHDFVVCSIEKNRGGVDGIDLEFKKHFDEGRFDPVGRVVVEQLLDDRVYVE